MRFGDVEQVAAGDGQLLWAAQGRGDGGLGPGVRAWRHGGALAVASPGLSRRDRLAVTGGSADAVVLVRQVLQEVGPSYRPFGEASLVDALVRQTPGLVLVPSFFWMESAVPPGSVTGDVQWLNPCLEPELESLFERFFPDSHAQPGREGVRRWAGVCGEADGNAGEKGPLAVAADAWSAAGCGFLAGAVTHPVARGRGLAQAVCGFVVDALVQRHGRAALMVDACNAPAVAAYERLGMAKRLFAGAHVPGR
ncbi:GNAT family N-acetyltransferase [Streptomyces sp. x-19]|uniref:GNAT family N-acetyltransferase n=1 Tax=Streptomyces sp. x-19 TaxID=2789280 RepID=UPI00397F00FE